MNILLISANTETMNMIPLPLGLNLVAVAAREAGHRVRMLDLMGGADTQAVVGNAITEHRPDLIGISVRNVDNQHMVETKFLLEPVREVVRLCRKLAGVPVVVGGAGFSIFPDAVLSYLQADLGICGEGEAAFIGLLDAIEKKRDLPGLPGVCFPGQSISCDVLRASPADLPVADPAFWSVPPGEGVWIPFQTRRGCPFRCSYCSTPTLEGTVIRTSLVERVLEGLGRHVSAGYDSFYFVDNTFNFPPQYAKDLCTGIVSSGLGIRWRCILYPGFVDEDLIRAMAEAGCVEVSLGFESGSASILRSLNKKYGLDDVRQASTLLKRYGITQMGFLLFGAPGETRETVLESLAFAESLDLDMLKVTAGIRIYPDTALAEFARSEGLVPGSDDLLAPRFYLARGLEEWLPAYISEWVASRPWCTT